MKSRTFLFILLVASISLIVTGCATLFAPQKQKVFTSSDPKGAEIFVNGVRMGTTPFTLDLKANQEYMVEFKKDGFKTVGQKINTKVGAGWVILDVLGGIVPVIIDAATGSWKKLDQDNLNAYLEKEK